MEAISVISRQSANKTSLSVLHTASNDDFCFRSSTPIPEDERLTLLIFLLAIWRARSEVAYRSAQSSCTQLASRLAVEEEDYQETCIEARPLA